MTAVPTPTHLSGSRSASGLLTGSRLVEPDDFACGPTAMTHSLFWLFVLDLMGLSAVQLLPKDRSKAAAGVDKLPI